jgi:anti-sigma B factor antagonist
MDLKLNWYRRDGRVVIEVTGELDVYTAPRLRELLIDLINKGEYNLIVDMEMMEFLDSGGLGVLVGGLKRVRAHDGSLHIARPPERVLRILRASTLFNVFPPFDTVDEALTVSPEVKKLDFLHGPKGRRWKAGSE